MLTSAQLATLKADIAANTNQIGGVQIKDMPNNDDAAFAIAAWYSANASPDFNVFRSNIPVDEVYDQITWANFTPSDAPDNTATWTNRSLSCQGKQFNLQTMLVGRASFNAGKITQRAGLNDAGSSSASSCSSGSSSTTTR